MSDPYWHKPRSGLECCFGLRFGYHPRCFVELKNPGKPRLTKEKYGIPCFWEYFGVGFSVNGPAFRGMTPLSEKLPSCPVNGPAAG